MMAAIWAAGVCDVSRGAELQDATAAAFDAYVRKSEARMDAELNAGGDFLWIDGSPWEERSAAFERLRAGQPVVENAKGKGAGGGVAVTGGLIHDWRGVVFVPGITVAETIALLEDYDHDDTYYWPDVVRSRLMRRDGETFHVYLRLKRKYAVTAAFDTEYDIRYTTVNSTRAYSRSRSTRIEEVENEGQADERPAASGNDHGFLWRLNSYWRFEQRDGGVFIECQAISLTRDVPQGLGWVVKPLVEEIPRESLRFTLEATQVALLKKYGLAAKKRQSG